MLTDAQERWLTALESGEYKQGKGLLHKTKEDGEYFCCLGVACHLFKNELELNHSRYDNVVRYNGEWIYLPFVVRKHLMLRSSFGDPDKGESLTYLNDNDKDGKTFKEIAAIIRSNPYNYFKEIDNHVN